MTDAEILDKLGQCLKIVMSKELDPEAVSLDASLRDDIGVSSLEAVELIFEVEEAFDAKISDEEAEKLGTVGDVLACIRGKLGAA